jgi:hypothetical protein
MFKLLFGFVVLASNYSFANTDAFNRAAITQNAFTVIQKFIPNSHPEFKPGAIKDLNILRLERNGIIDFTYTSQNGKFRGNVYCQISQLIRYDEKYSSLNDTCFRANIYERDDKAINGFGKQIGIY